MLKKMTFLTLLLWIPFGAQATEPVSKADIIGKNDESNYWHKNGRYGRHHKHDDDHHRHHKKKKDDKHKKKKHHKKDKHHDKNKRR